MAKKSHHHLKRPYDIILAGIVILAAHHRGFDLISDVLPFGRLWYAGPDAVANAIDYARYRGRSHDAVIRVYDEAGNVIQTHEHAGDFKENARADTLLRLVKPSPARSGHSSGLL